MLDCFENCEIWNSIINQSIHILSSEYIFYHIWMNWLLVTQLTWYSVMSCASNMCPIHTYVQHVTSLDQTWHVTMVLNFFFPDFQTFINNEACSEDSSVSKRFSSDSITLPSLFRLQNLTNDDKCIVKLSFDKLMVRKTSKSCVTDWINRFY